MKKNGTKPEKKKTPSYEEGKVRDPAVRKLQNEKGVKAQELFRFFKRATQPLPR